MSFGLFAAFCHACGPSNNFGDLNEWIIKPIQNLLKKLREQLKKKKTAEGNHPEVQI